MNKAFKLILLAGGMVAASSFAGATTINAVVTGTTANSVTQKATISSTAPTFIDLLDFASFNTSLGTLTGIQLSAEADFNVTVNVHNPYSDVPSINYYEIDAAGSSAVTGPFSASPITLNATASKFSTDSLDGDPVNSNQTLTFTGVTASTTTTTSLTDFSDFTGNGSSLIALGFQGGAYSISGASDSDPHTGQSLQFSGSGTNSGFVTLTYIYTPNSAPTSGAPEPGTWLLMGTSLGGLFAARKRFSL